MRKLILIVLCGAMLLDGCYSYSVLESGDKEQQLPPDDESIHVTLKNGSVIESEAFHHIVVNVPSNFIYGVGTSMKRFLAKEQNYNDGNYIGRIDASLIDSSKVWNYEGAGYRDYWLKDSLRIRFMEGDYVIVTPDQGTGLWCMGRKSGSKSDSLFTGKVNLSDVKSIEIKKFFAGRPIWIGALTGAGAGLLLAATSEHKGDGVEYIIAPVLFAFIGLLVGSIIAVAW